MSAPTSPGRTWTFRVAERQLLVLVRTAATGIFVSGAGIARLSNPDREAASAFLANLGNQSDPGREHGSQSGGRRNLDRALVPISVDHRSKNW